MVLQRGDLRGGAPRHRPQRHSVPGPLPARGAGRQLRAAPLHGAAQPGPAQPGPARLGAAPRHLRRRRASLAPPSPQRPIRAGGTPAPRPGGGGTAHPPALSHPCAHPSPLIHPGSSIPAHPAPLIHPRSSIPPHPSPPLRADPAAPPPLPPVRAASPRSRILRCAASRITLRLPSPPGSLCAAPFLQPRAAVAALPAL